MSNVDKSGRKKKKKKGTAKFKKETWDGGCEGDLYNWVSSCLSLKEGEREWRCYNLYDSGAIRVLIFWKWAGPVGFDQPYFLSPITLGPFFSLAQMLFYYNQTANCKNYYGGICNYTLKFSIVYIGLSNF